MTKSGRPVTEDSGRV